MVFHCRPYKGPEAIYPLPPFHKLELIVLKEGNTFTVQRFYRNFTNEIRQPRKDMEYSIFINLEALNQVNPPRMSTVTGVSKRRKKNEAKLESM